MIFTSVSRKNDIDLLNVCKTGDHLKYLHVAITDIQVDLDHSNGTRKGGSILLLG